MTYEFAKYPDGTIGVFSNIGKKENGEEYIRITFERPKEYGFDTYVIELPSYNVVLEDGNCKLIYWQNNLIEIIFE